MDCRFRFIRINYMYESIVNIRLLILAAILMAIFTEFSTGCTNDQAINKTLVEQYTASPKKDDEITRLNELLFAAAQMNDDPSDYLLGASDLLQITVFESKDLNTTVRVSSRGYITLPLLGQVKVKGLTAREAEVNIEDLYREKYIKDPHVSVFVEEHFSKPITVLGQFRNPGTYDFKAKQRLLDVMALAGGLTDKAGRTVQIRRKEITPGEPNVFVVDLDRFIKEGRSELNIEISSGDVIFVPEAGNFFVDGAVRRPGSYPIKRKMVIREALMAAGGIAPYAQKDSLVLIRYFEGKGREIIELELNDPEHQETEIQDRDIVIVKSSALGKMLHGVGIHFGIPGFTVGYTDPAR